MADPRYSRDEVQFLRETGIDLNDLEHLVADEPPSAPGVQARIRQRALGQIQQEVGSMTRRAVRSKSRQTRSRTRLGWLATVATVAASVVAAVLIVPGLGRADVAQAMEKALANLSSYHGVVESESIDANGKRTATPGTNEIWASGDKFARLQVIAEKNGAGSSESWWVTDGDREWYYNNGDHGITVGPAIHADQMRDDLGVSGLAREALRGEHKVIGTEVVLGRKTTKLEVKSPEGRITQLWVDDQTNLPLRVQWPVSGGGQTILTYKQFEANPQIDPARFTLTAPEGFAIHKSPGEWVKDLPTAAKVAGFSPLAPKQQPARIAAWPKSVVMVYDGMIVTQMSMAYQFHDLQSAGAVGQAGGGPVLFTKDGERVEWNQDGRYFMAEGSDPERLVTLVRTFVPDLALPEGDLIAKAAFKLPGEPAAAEAKVKLGGRPEQRDPLEASFTFVKTQLGGKVPFHHLSPEETDLQVVAKNRNQAVIEAPSGPYKRFYVQRIVTPDVTNWYVVGYDPR